VLMKLEAAAKELGVAYYWLRNEVVAGTLPAMRTSGDKGTWLVDIEHVKAAIITRMETKGVANDEK